MLKKQKNIPLELHRPQRFFSVMVVFLALSLSLLIGILPGTIYAQDDSGTRCADNILTQGQFVEVSHTKFKYNQPIRLYFVFTPAQNKQSCFTDQALKTIYFRVTFDITDATGIAKDFVKTVSGNFTTDKIVGGKQVTSIEGGFEFNYSQAFTIPEQVFFSNPVLSRVEPYWNVDIIVEARQIHPTSDDYGQPIGRQTGLQVYRSDVQVDLPPPQSVTRPKVDSKDIDIKSGTGIIGGEQFAPNELGMVFTAYKEYRAVKGSSVPLNFEARWANPTRIPDMAPPGLDEFKDPLCSVVALDCAQDQPDLTGVYFSVSDQQGFQCGRAEIKSLADLFSSCRGLQGPANPPIIDSTILTVNFKDDLILPATFTAAAAPKTYYLFPIFRVIRPLSITLGTLPGAWPDFALITNQHTFKLKLFNSAEELIKDCTDEYLSRNPGDTAGAEKKCGTGTTLGSDPYSVGDPTETTITSNETGSSPEFLGAVLSFLAKILSGLIYIFSNFLYGIFYFFLAPLIEALLSIRTYTGDFSGVIYPGWEVLRNLSNIFFIIALLAIALTTIFRVQGYQWKHMLVDLVIAAILVNFSLVIGQGILGIADTVQNQFLPNNGAAIRQLGRELMVAPIEWNITSTDISANLGGGLGDLVLPMFYLAISLAAFVMFFALMVFLAIRIVMLWILLMLSPMAYALRVLKATEHYAKEWWSNFLKYAFFTPIIALFLNVAALIIQNQRPVLDRVAATAELSGQYFLPLLVKAGGGVVMMVFMFAAIKVAQTFSIFGAAALTGAAEKGLKFPFGKARQGAAAVKDRSKEFAQDKALSFKEASLQGKGGLKGAVGSVLLTGDKFKAAKHEREALRKDKAETVSAHMQDRFLDKKGLPAHRVQELEAKRQAKVDELYKDRTRAQLLQDLQHAGMRIKNAEEKSRAVAAIVKELARGDNLDDLLIDLGGSNDTNGFLKAMDEIERIGNLTKDQKHLLKQKLTKFAIENKKYSSFGADVSDASGNPVDTRPAAAYTGPAAAGQEHIKYEGQKLYEEQIEKAHFASDADRQARIDSIASTLPAGQAEQFRNYAALQSIQKKQARKILDQGAQKIAQDVKGSNFVSEDGKLNFAGGEFFANLSADDVAQKKAGRIEGTKQDKFRSLFEASNHASGRSLNPAARAELRQAVIRKYVQETGVDLADPLLPTAQRQAALDAINGTPNTIGLVEQQENRLRQYIGITPIP